MKKICVRSGILIKHQPDVNVSAGNYRQVFFYKFMDNKFILLSFSRLWSQAHNGDTLVSKFLNSLIDLWRFDC